MLINILFLDPNPQNNTFQFDGAIAMSDAHSNELKWYVKPQFMRGKILYKVRLHRDHVGTSDPFVDIVVAHQYFIPSQLLQLWDSKQKFDVTIEAITAYTSVEANQTALMAPTKPPSAPVNLQCFVTQQKTVDGAQSLIDLVWQPPDQWNGEAVGYRVNCSIDNTAESTNIANLTGVDKRRYEFSIKSGKIECVVSATNEPFEDDSFGPMSMPIIVDSTGIDSNK
jgi:hypothetical protein